MSEIASAAKTLTALNSCGRLLHPHHLHLLLHSWSPEERQYNKRAGGVLLPALSLWTCHPTLGSGEEVRLEKVAPGCTGEASLVDGVCRIIEKSRDSFLSLPFQVGHSLRE